MAGEPSELNEAVPDEERHHDSGKNDAEGQRQVRGFGRRKVKGERDGVQELKEH